MRFFSFLVFALLFRIPAVWETDVEQAKQKAQQEHKYILLNFSGSDWCGPCIRLHDEIFESSIFKTFADSNLVLLNADFPRLKKNQLSKEQQKKNDLLADQYDPGGSFPYTILLDENGKSIHIWDGFPPVTPVQFVKNVKDFCNVRQ